MGINAHMIIRNVPRAVVTDEWLKVKSWHLCRSIGADNFFISDGLPPAEYEKHTKEWHAKFDAHPLYAEYSESYDRERFPNRDGAWRSTRERIVADIGEYNCSQYCTAIERVGTRYREEGEPEPGTHYCDDGSVELVAKPDECLLQVNLYGRYYGEGYERGDILKYCAIAEWLEQNINGCEIWYGGDSSGVTIRRFDSQYREQLRKHLYSQEGRDYFNHGMRSDHGAVPPACGLCPGGKYCGSQFGTGASYAAFSCAGCGKSVETRDHGKTWQPHKDR